MSAALATAVGLGLALPAPAFAGGPAECSAALASLGCPDIGANLDTSEAILEAIQPGGEAVFDSVFNEDEGESDEESRNLAQQPTPPPAENCSPTNVATCAGEATATPEDPEAPVVVTLRDIASFRPAMPGNEMEPGGWAIEGLHANFVAEASVEVVSGTLLGQPADVRFTPVGYRWAHSDGTAIDSATPGATWAALGQREFTETPTSHVYAASGEYTVVLTVVLSAEYRFAGSSWRSIAGTLTLAGEPQRVLVGQFDTVLANGDCNAHPSGPGC